MTTRRPVVSAAVAVAFSFAAATAGCGIASTTVPGTAVTATTETLSQQGTGVAGGTPFRDGELEFVLLEVSATHQVGDPADPGMSMNAKGIFVAVTIAIRNLGAAPITFFDRDQTLIDDTGRKFSPSMAADIYANPGIRSTRISPGDQLVVHIVFDVPVETKPENLLLRESSSSAGVAVPLR